MRDIISVPFGNEDTLIVACDNSGAIGMKEQDHVHVPYETVAYFSFRVAAMECIAAGGQPMCVVLHNFCGNEPWDELVMGIQKGLKELGLKDIPITGSSESNFSLHQSAIGLIILGKRTDSKWVDLHYSPQLKFAVIGQPLVGPEVVEQAEQIVPLSLFQKVAKLQEVMIWPVGSKGILFELNQMFQDVTFSLDMVSADVDILKSSGPATCFIVVYHADDEEKVKNSTGDFFLRLQIEMVKK
ncbi:ATP-binding protein [Neobacillus pocheonensis]|uniref:ATP-binding protein n=1 Tax=Neobacillus pocheonensis TaxID=363869 RepID=UPI003D2A7F6E